jgi:integrase
LGGRECIAATLLLFRFHADSNRSKRGEVGGMTWAQIDLPGRVWTLPGSRAKNKVEHQSETAVSILKAIPRTAGCNFVFTANGKGAFKGHHLLKPRLDKLMPTVTPKVMHDIRRTVATGMAKLGVTLPVVEKLLNHVSGSFAVIVGVYQLFDYADQKRAAVELWAKHIEQISTGVGVGNNVVPLHGSR